MFISQTAPPAPRRSLPPTHSLRRGMSRTYFIGRLDSAGGGRSARAPAKAGWLCFSSKFSLNPARSQQNRSRTLPARPRLEEFEGRHRFPIQGFTCGRSREGTRPKRTQLRRHDAGPEDTGDAQFTACAIPHTPPHRRRPRHDQKERKSSVHALLFLLPLRFLNGNSGVRRSRTAPSDSAPAPPPRAAAPPPPAPADAARPSCPVVRRPRTAPPPAPG